MFGKKINSVLISLTACQLHAAFATPTNIAPDTLLRHGSSPVEIRHGQDAAIAYTCEKDAPADWQINKDNIHGECYSIPDGAAEVSMDFDRNVYDYFCVTLYLLRDCKEIDYGSRWKNIWNERGSYNLYQGGGCANQPELYVGGDYKKDAKWRSYRVGYIDK